MLDTTVFNHLLRGGVDPTTLPQSIFVTHIQRDEIGKTKDTRRRGALFGVLGKVQAQSVPTENAVWDVSRHNEAKWGKEDGLWERMLGALGARNKDKGNNKQDILIAETAIRNNYVLVTDDRDLGEVVREFGGTAITLNELLAR